jgi:hypothetical protein
MTPTYRVHCSSDLPRIRRKRAGSLRRPHIQEHGAGASTGNGALQAIGIRRYPSPCLSFSTSPRLGNG